MTSLSPNKLTLNDLSNTPINNNLSSSILSSGINNQNQFNQSRLESMPSPPKILLNSFKDNSLYLRMTKKSPNPIYEWENGKTRTKIEVDSIGYVPTKTPGIYEREEKNEVTNNKYIDIKVILTPNEMVTLLARKKAMKRVKNQGLFTEGSGSVQSSTPYIDPSRVIKETYRPDQPHKWIQGAYHNK